MISAEGLSIRSGAFRLENISFRVETGQCAALMGRTGAGKTTLLEAICGLRRPERGVIRILGRDATGLRPGERGIGYVPQDGALFTTMSVRENIAFSLRARRWSDGDVRARVAALAALTDLEPLLERRPGTLSGGEAQRVALARALAFHPRALLLDEPLSALDEPAREAMREVIARVRTAAGVTILHVTHSREEAERLADVMLVLRDGAVTQEPTR